VKQRNTWNAFGTEILKMTGLQAIFPKQLLTLFAVRYFKDTFQPVEVEPPI
jgi:hypothetical protein